MLSFERLKLVVGEQKEDTKKNKNNFCRMMMMCFNINIIANHSSQWVAYESFICVLLINI